MADDRRSPFADLAVVRGWPEARETIADWVRSPLRVVGPWIVLAAAVGIVLLALVWIVGSNVAADPSGNHKHLLSPHPDWTADAMRLFRNNVTVLALHGFACLAGFIVYTAMHDPSTGDNARLEQLTRTLALVAVLFVPIATVLSIVTQAWVLGSRASTLASHFHMPVGAVLGSTLQHSLPELAAVFLPLAAAIVLQVRRRPDQLLAATILSVVVAIPVIGIAAVLEARTWPMRLSAAKAAANSVVPGSRLDFNAFGAVSQARLAVDPTDRFSASVSLKDGPLVSGPISGIEAAEAAAARVGGLTMLIVDQGQYGVYRVLGRWSPNTCDVFDGVEPDREPRTLRMDDIAALRLEEHAKFGAELVMFVEGDRRLLPNMLDPGPIETSVKSRCS